MVKGSGHEVALDDYRAVADGALQYSRPPSSAATDGGERSSPSLDAREEEGGDWWAGLTNHCGPTQCPTAVYLGADYQTTFPPHSVGKMSACSRHE